MSNFDFTHLSIHATNKQLFYQIFTFLLLKDQTYHYHCLKSRHCPPLLAPVEQVSSSVVAIVLLSFGGRRDSGEETCLVELQDGGRESGGSSTEAGNARSPPLSCSSWARRWCSSIDIVTSSPSFDVTIFYTLQQKIKDGPRGNGTAFKKCGGTFFGGSERWWVVF